MKAHYFFEEAIGAKDFPAWPNHDSGCHVVGGCWTQSPKEFRQGNRCQVKFRFLRSGRRNSTAPSRFSVRRYRKMRISLSAEQRFSIQMSRVQREQCWRLGSFLSLRGRLWCCGRSLWAWRQTECLAGSKRSDLHQCHGECTGSLSRWDHWALCRGGGSRVGRPVEGCQSIIFL